MKEGDDLMAATRYGINDAAICLNQGHIRQVPQADCVSQSQIRLTQSKPAAMSALPPIADIGTQSRHVRFVPKADTQRVRQLCRRLRLS